jgi:hypothetical protein
MKRLSNSELDKIGLRLAEIEEEDERLRGDLKLQIAEYGFAPPRSEKSKRLETLKYKFTLSTSSSTEIRDAEVERIRANCPKFIFEKLFLEITKFKLSSGATALLAGTLPEEAPRNLRQMFARAVVVSEGSTRLKVEALDVEVPA